MSDIFREVDEEVRHEQYKKLWAQYGHFAIAAAIVIAGGTLAYQGWQSYSKSQRESQADQYVAAVELLASEDTPDRAIAAFQEVARESGTGYRLLAALREAALLAHSGQITQAVAVYDQISSDSAFESIFQDLAKIRAAQALADSASLSDIKTRVASLLTDLNPWRFSAREIVALAAYREGNLAEARAGFESLVLDPLAPQSVKTRANEMISALGPGDVQETQETSTAPVVSSEKKTVLPESSQEQ